MYKNTDYAFALVYNKGGLFSRILTCIAALIGGILPLTGYYIWLRRVYQGRRAKKSSHK